MPQPDSWNDPVTLTSFIIAVTGLAAAVGGIVSAWRAHRTVNKEIRPQLNEVQQEVKNGTTDS